MIPPLARAVLHFRPSKISAAATAPVTKPKRVASSSSRTPTILLLLEALALASLIFVCYSLPCRIATVAAFSAAVASTGTVRFSPLQPGYPNTYTYTHPYLRPLRQNREGIAENPFRPCHKYKSTRIGIVGMTSPIASGVDVNNNSNDDSASASGDATSDATIHITTTTTTNDDSSSRESPTNNNNNNNNKIKRRKTMAALTTSDHKADRQEGSDSDNSNDEEEDPLLTRIPDGVLTTTLRETDGSPLKLPTKLAYPFWYDPHPIAKWAADRLKEELPPYHDGNHGDDNYENNDNDKGTSATIASGKMYGVLVVGIHGSGPTDRDNNSDNSQQQLRYLKAYSGALLRPQYGGNIPTDDNTAMDAGFCPLVYDRFQDDDKYDDGDDFRYEQVEEVLNGYTREIERLETCRNRAEREIRWKEREQTLREKLGGAKKKQKSNKRERKERRNKVRKRLLEELQQEKDQGQEQQQQQQQQQEPNVDDVRAMSDKESHNYFLQHNQEYRLLEDRLVQESAADQREFKTLRAGVQDELDRVLTSLSDHHSQIDTLRRLRKEGSIDMQKQLFERYKLRNVLGEIQTPVEIFRETPLGVPPSGTGDCAAIKLFQHAFAKGYSPIALAEFWWGPSPHNSNNNSDHKTDTNFAIRSEENDLVKTSSSTSDVARTHGNYYPCCRGKCEPILTRHMLIGTNVDSDPLTEGLTLSLSSSKDDQGAARDKNTKEIPLSIVYEDEWLVVVNKPHDVLSVPGRQVSDSIKTKLQKRYPRAKGPLLVHRLDYSTSGLLLAAKDAETHKRLQAQFIQRTVKKRYTALLEGELRRAAGGSGRKKGTIDLPLAGDYLNRPMQKVERGPEGKSAVTHYEIVEEESNTNSNSNQQAHNDDNHKRNQKQRKRTRVRFYPQTGRTHQLRIHASHPEGLGVAIVGDDIYGQRDERLCLHAAFLEITHPHTGGKTTFEAPDPF